MFIFFFFVILLLLTIPIGVGARAACCIRWSITARLISSVSCCCCCSCCSFMRRIWSCCFCVCCCNCKRFKRYGMYRRFISHKSKSIDRLTHWTNDCIDWMRLSEQTQFIYTLKKSNWMNLKLFHFSWEREWRYEGKRGVWNICRKVFTVALIIYGVSKTFLGDTITRKYVPHIERKKLKN